MEEQADENYRIEFSEPFEADLDTVYLRLSRLSPESAHRWQTGILAACLSLDRFPRRCRLAPDSQDFGREVRQLIYRNRRTVYQILYTIFEATAAAQPASAQGVTTYDPAASFSTTSNPNGVFSYGEISAAGGPFAAFDNANRGNNNGLDVINDPASGAEVDYNGTAMPITDRSQTFLPGGLSIHDGNGGQLGVVRFTAPTAGTYSFVGSFYAGDTNADNTVSVLDNGTSVFSGTRAGSSATPFANAGLSLAAGDTLDFAVGGQYVYGDTGLQTAITGAAAPVPEASTTVSLGLMLMLGLGAAARKKQVA